jgi:hypothetical protein
MRKKIIGILICTLLIATALPAMGMELGKVRQATENMNKGDRQECGTVWIILSGNTTAIIGAKIFLRYSIGLCIGQFVLTPFTWGGISGDIELINDSANPFNGCYGHRFDVCGFYRVSYTAPPDTNCTAAYKPYFILRTGELITEYIVLPVEYKP